MWRSALKFFRRFPVSPLICFALAWGLTRTTRVESIEWRTLDWRTELRTSLQPPPDSRITVVIFDDLTDANLAPWPPDRGVHGDLIGLLTLAGVKVISWDVILDASREGDGDAKMARAAAIAMNANSPVVTAAVTNSDPEDPSTAAISGPTRPLTDIRGDITKLLGDHYAIRPFPLLRRASYYGFADVPHGPDGVQREVPLVVRIGSVVYPSLSLQTLMAYFGVDAAKVRVRLGDAIYLPTKTQGEIRIPVSDGGRYLLNYRYDERTFNNGVWTDFQYLSYYDATTNLYARYWEKKPVFPGLKRLAGGIVFIGEAVTGKADAGPTPLNAYSPLVYVHANLVNNVLKNDYARKAPPWTVWLGAVLVGYAGLLLGLRRSIWVLAAFTVLAIACYVEASVAAWVEWSLWLPLVGPLAGFGMLQFIVIGRRVLQEQHHREQVKQMFGTYLSPELLKKMMKGGVSVAEVSSERKPVSILFTDLRDFTSMTESLRDDQLIAQLNEYLAAMVECIHQEGGTLHKFIGDAVMAVWGDLTSAGAATDAAKAARAGLAMLTRLAELNEKWKGEGRPAFRMGIGLNHGTVLIGNIGSPRRMEFTAIGDSVNLASRLESLNKELKTTFLVGESVRDLIDGEFMLRPCGDVHVKGKAKPVQVYELTGPKLPEGNVSVSPQN